MTTHITVRLAWHNQGWNGHICQNPKANTYCVGRHSYPGDLISDIRDTEWEMSPDVAGKPCSRLNGVPACAYSINAFGDQHMKAFAEPPEWFGDGSKGVYLDIPPSTICTWPYEAMYNDDVQNKSGNGQKYDYDKRLSKAKDYFSKLEVNKSLIFYYANYSNPFSEDDKPQYVLVGISRLKEVGKIKYYDNVSEENKAKYAGGFVWQMPLTSHYPEQGLRIPYEKYMDRQEVLERILFVPEHTRSFKYATREISNDDALSVVEKMLEIVNYLIEIEDDSQDWGVRRSWLNNLLSELWENRGAYPGLSEVIRYIGFSEAISYYYTEAEKGNGKAAYNAISDFLQGNIQAIPELKISDLKIKELQRNWKLREDEERKLLINILPRFDIAEQQIRNILKSNREENSIYSSIKDIMENPYILSEQYIGDDNEDYITFNKIDNGLLPSPELGIDPLTIKNSAERFRALCVDSLKRENTHAFVTAKRIIEGINRKLEYSSEWKKHEFTRNYLEVDSEIIQKAITYRKNGDILYLYLNEVYEDEIIIQETIREIAQRGDIKLKTPATSKHFYDLLKVSNSPLNNLAAEEYDKALLGQAEVCTKVFCKPLCVISGAAGTGKTTIIKAIIKNIERVHGVNTSILLMAPTGKATERIKEKTNQPSSTIHSFLAQKGWLNGNLTFKRIGGSVEQDISTIIIDECSMIDLNLFATLLRAIKWGNVQRLILIGDPNQLPPIGRGKVFSDIIEWLKDNYVESLGKLDINVRQLENRVTDRGNGILELANIFIQENQAGGNFDKLKQEEVIKRVQEGGVIDKDLSVQYWKDTSELETLIKQVVIDDIENDTGEKLVEGKEYLLWDKGCRKKNDQFKDATYLQILSPFRGEEYGIENLNIIFQNLFNGFQASKRTLDGIALFDKVIQFRNRPKSDPIYAFDVKNREGYYTEVYNGEIGFVKQHGLDNDKWKSPWFKLERFQVVFNGKENLWVGYGSKLLKDNNNRWIPEQKPEENLELAYAISVHKAQGSEFDRVYFVLPKRSSRLLSMELLYTAITRAQRHLTLFVQEDISSLISLTRIEGSGTRRINSSIFKFNPIPEAFIYNSGWFEEGKVISTLTDYFVRSKSEMNIANILFLNDISFTYEEPLYANDGTMYLPDFTIKWRGETYYWEHVGRLDLPKYKEHWEEKQRWYDKHFPGQLLVTYEGQDQSKQIEKILCDTLGITI